MSPAGKPLWTTGRRLLGNMIPLVLSVPLLAYGLSRYPAEGLTGKALMGMAGFLVVAWLATNFLGLVGGGGLRDQMAGRLHRERPFDRTEKVFVGFARPAYHGLLDPHEDVGYLILHPDRVEFFGSDISVEVPRERVTEVRHRPNPHSYIGLGGWVSIEGTIDGQPVRLLVEPREKPTLLGNKRLGRELVKRLQEWAKGG